MEEDGGSTEPKSSSSAKGLTKGSKLAEAGVSESDIQQAVSLEGLDPHDHPLLVGIDHLQDIRLKKTYATWLLRLVTVQLIVADAVFITYAWAGEHWRLDTSVIQVWLVATLVELIGVALVVTRNLFPRRDRKPSEDPTARP